MSAAIEQSEFIPIHVVNLVPTEANAGFDLYRRDLASKKHVLYRGSALALRQSDIETLQERGFEHLYMTPDAYAEYQIFLRDLVGIDGPGFEASLSTRISALNEVAREALGASFRSGDTSESIETAGRLAKLAAEIFCHDEFHEAELFRVLHHDDATFTHSANVGFYAGILAKQLGFADEDIRSIITGGLLHDLGMLDIDKQILGKPARLEENELREVQRHPIFGIQKLAHRSELTEGQLMMVYQHHERFDGTGYPVGLVGDEIHPWAKICAVVDVFEALTSHRPYRNPKGQDLVVALLQRGGAKSFDPEISSCWVNITRTFWQS